MTLPLHGVGARCRERRPLPFFARSAPERNTGPRARVPVLGPALRARLPSHPRRSRKPRARGPEKQPRKQLRASLNASRFAGRRRLALAPRRASRRPPGNGRCRSRGLRPRAGSGPGLGAFGAFACAPCRSLAGPSRARLRQRRQSGAWKQDGGFAAHARFASRETETRSAHRWTLALRVGIGLRPRLATTAARLADRVALAERRRLALAPLRASRRPPGNGRCRSRGLRSLAGPALGSAPSAPSPALATARLPGRAERGFASADKAAPGNRTAASPPTPASRRARQKPAPRVAGRSRCAAASAFGLTSGNHRCAAHRSRRACGTAAPGARSRRLPLRAPRRPTGNRRCRSRGLRPLAGAHPVPGLGAPSAPSPALPAGRLPGRPARGFASADRAAPGNRTAAAPPAPASRRARQKPAPRVAGRSRCAAASAFGLAWQPPLRCAPIASRLRNGGAWRSLRFALHGARLGTGAAALAAFVRSPVRPWARRLRPLRLRSLPVACRAVPSAPGSAAAH